MSLQEDAQLALRCLDSENAGAVKTRPPAPAGYTLKGYLSAVDALFHLGPIFLRAERVFYGWWLSNAVEEILIVRGTASSTEWWEDGQFMPRAHKASGGLVEDGFSSIYATMLLEDAKGEPIGFAAEAIAEACGAVTIAGHSLGGALVQQLAADVGSRACRVKARIFASPRCGDAAFVNWVDRSVDDCVSYRFAPDLVPDVPPGLGYELLPGTIVLPDDPRVKRSIDAWHHVSSGYAPQLDHSLPIDPAFLATPA